jgi:hypothetical protein
MLKGPSSCREEIVGRVVAGERVVMAFVDPGTNAAVRYIEARLGEGRPEFRVAGQEFFRCKGKCAGADYSENSALLGKQLASSALFGGADYYFLENQHEKNVMITLGYIIGVLGALRAGELEVATRKRTEGYVVVRMPYRVLGVPTWYKGDVMNRLAPGAGDLKERAVAAAKMICERDGDDESLALMREAGVAHDIADTVCYGEAVSTYLWTGAEPRRGRAPHGGKQ